MTKFAKKNDLFKGHFRSFYKIDRGLATYLHMRLKTEQEFYIYIHMKDYNFKVKQQILFQTVSCKKVLFAKIIFILLKKKYRYFSFWAEIKKITSNGKNFFVGTKKKFPN